MAIDSRLLDCDSIPQVEENFDRVLAAVDSQSEVVEGQGESIEQLQEQLGALKVCRVAFNSDGGGAVSEQIMLNGAKIAAPADPVKAGFIFAGWYREDVAWDFDTAVADSMTLTAHWTEEEAG